MKRKVVMFLTYLFIGIGLASAQVRTVHGNVSSAEDGLPVVGASVVVDGTTLGTVTDIDGNFSVSNVPSSAKTLTVSYIGMKSQTLAIKSNLKVSLEPDTEQLDEVMVVAFGTAKKSAFTGSAAVVGKEDIAKHVTTNVANTLAGSVPGLQIRGTSGQPGSDSGKFKIRGIASLYAGEDPLVIVDGAPYTASLSNINPDDIESVSVLKDAASAALYGARGAAGVILITTKKGNNHDAQVTLNAKWGVNSRAVQDYDTIDDPAEYYEAYYAQVYNNYFYGQGMSAAAANAAANKKTLSDLVYQAYTVPEGQYLIGMNGKINPAATLGYQYTGANGTTYYVTPDNWKDLAYKTALRQEYDVSINGGSDRSSFYASAGYLNEDGIIEFSGYERFNARVRAELQAKNWLKIGANVNFVHSNQDSNPNLSGSSLNSTNILYYTSNIAPIYPAYIRTVQNGVVGIATDMNGNPSYDYGVPATNYYGLSRPFLSTGNPLGSNTYNKVTSKGNQLNGSFNADITIMPWLKAAIQSTAILGQSNFSDYENPFFGPKVVTNGEIQKSSSTTFRTNHVQTLTFLKDFGEHNVKVLLGHEYYKTRTKYLWAKATGGFSPAIKEINGFATKSDSESYTNKYNVEGYFGNVEYNFAEKYFASASYRRDATSRFAKDHRWGSFWSVGGAWMLTKEAFMKNLTWVDMLKLKVSIGQQGNDNIGNWAYTDMYSLSKGSDTSISPSFFRVGNQDITWETTTNLNVGLEFNLFKNRLNGTIDFYNKKTTDLLFWLSIPESAGSRGYYGNIGDIRNRGVELTLTGVLVRTKDIDWSVSGNIAHNSTKILKLPEAKITENGGFTETNLWYEEGGPLYNAFRAKYAGVNEQGEATYWVDNSLNGATNKPGKNYDTVTTNPNKASKYALGSLLPKAYGGFGTSFRWKGIDASLQFDYQLGGKIYDRRYSGLMSPCETSNNAGSAFHKDILKSWSPNNASSNIPRWQFGDQYTAAASDRWLTSASYLNFQSFTIGYTLPKLTKEISKIRIYAAGENLCFWSARKGLDPRYSYSTTETINQYSPVRTISGGIQLTF
ncbi:MAG: SusC/RagA family TonB-linked outer membrane protein [Phocaeicola sp.]|uniref:SusC/RagA family TonB-linked outer membrane protein n=1 Tax=Phocaeicola sp. TaxID=2773926 RepID=UPI003F9F86C7